MRDEVIVGWLIDLGVLAIVASIVFFLVEGKVTDPCSNSSPNPEYCTSDIRGGY